MTPQRRSQIAVIALVAANLFLHKRVSDLCDAVRWRLGLGAYERLALWSFVTVGAVWAAVLVARGTGRLRFRALALWLATLGLAALAQRWLLVVNIELVHLPQYALLALVLIGAGLTPETAWAGAVLLGALDEGYQHLVLYAGRPDTYLDYNDMLLNALGAQLAVVLVMARRPAALRPFGWPRWLLAGAMLAPSLWLMNAERAGPLLRIAATGHAYHVCSLAEAVALGATLWVMVWQAG
jgi:hypothetical protein